MHISPAVGKSEEGKNRYLGERYVTKITRSQLRRTPGNRLIPKVQIGDKNESTFHNFTRLVVIGRIFWTLEAIVRFDTRDQEHVSTAEHLLEHGIAKFKDFSYEYPVPSMTACELKKAEKRAQDAKLGVWAVK